MIHPTVSLSYASRRHASWLEKTVRKKIWGTETPPGQEDPYGKESVFDPKRRGREQAVENERGPESLPGGEIGKPKGRKPKGRNIYTPATTSDGLERVGDPGWGATEWEAENPFQGFDQFYCMHCDIY